MGTKLFNGRAVLIALIGAISASACAAQDYTAYTNPQTIRGGQGNYLITLPDTTPAPASYALTGEQSANRQSVQAWEKQAGPVYTVGNARIVIPTR
jgi:hypothetical protein